MEILFKLLFEIILEGSIEIGYQKSAPMPLRILAAFIVLAVFFVLGGLFVFMGYEAYLEDNTGVAIALFIAGAFWMFGGMYVIIKMFHKKAKLDKK